MNLFNLEGNGLMISIALTFLTGIVIVYYFRHRFLTLEKAHIEQAKILHRFIAYMQEKEGGVPLPMGPGGDIASPEVVAAAQQAHSEFSKETPQNLIDVSDDSQSESDSDASASETDESESEVENNDIVNLEVENIKVIDMPPLKGAEIEEVQLESMEDKDDLTSLSFSESEDETDTESNETDTESDNKEVDIEVSKIEDDEYEGDDEGNSSSNNKTCTLVNYKGLKVGALRNAVLEKGLVKSIEDAKKFKKQELLKLLEAK